MNTPNNALLAALAYDCEVVTDPVIRSRMLDFLVSLASNFTSNFHHWGYNKYSSLQYTFDTDSHILILNGNRESLNGHVIVHLNEGPNTCDIFYALDEFAPFFAASLDSGLTDTILKWQTYNRTHCVETCVAFLDRKTPSSPNLEENSSPEPQPIKKH